MKSSRLFAGILIFSLAMPTAALAEEDLNNETATTQLEGTEPILVIAPAPHYSMKATTSSLKTTIKISTSLTSTALKLVASKSGVKAKKTFTFKTNASGNYTLKSKVNLKGYTLVLLNGTTELSRSKA
jgi:hypothetical protein